MPYIVYLDEAGDHSMDTIDPQFPIFVLVMLACEIATYTNEIVPAFYRLKMEQCGDEAVIIHSRDIRRGEGDFAFLTDATRRAPFYEAVNEIMSTLDYALIACAIHKDRHKERYGAKAYDPYDLALKFGVERLMLTLEETGQTEITLIAEARGTREDEELSRALQRMVRYGTEYRARARFDRVRFNLKFEKKERNIIGTQMADLAAYPIARHVLDPAKPNPAYDIVSKKFHRGAIRPKIFP